ncbi:MAG: hypothetical protein EPO26_14685 [Chloroflexota bacterium]|nr:MAG: hypothetical protein EPO26_14685 [Chloroflexota bacterium]
MSANRAIFRHAAKYGAIARVTITTQTVYAGEVAVRAVFLAIVLYIFLQLWNATYSALGATTIAGFTIEQMIWYLTITEVIVISRSRFIREIDTEVRSGDIAYHLTRPYDYVLYRLAYYIGDRALRLTIGFGLGIPIAYAFVGPLDVRPEAVGLAVAIIMLGTLADFAASIAIGLCAFWVEDTAPFALLYERAIMLLGGMLLPLELFPDAIKAVVGVLPFQLLLYAPARLVVTGDSGLAPSWIAQLLVAIVVGMAIAWRVYAFAVSRLHANGG